METDLYKQLEVVIKEGNWAEMAELCEKFNFGAEAQEELFLRTLYRKYHSVD